MEEGETVEMVTGRRDGAMTTENIEIKMNRGRKRREAMITLTNINDIMRGDTDT